MGRKIQANRFAGGDFVTPPSFALSGPVTRCAVFGLLVACAFFTIPDRIEARGLVGARAYAMAIVQKAKAQTQAQAKPQTPSVIADAVHLDNGRDHATLTFDLSAPVKVNAFVLANPDRVVVDLPDVNFQIDPRAGVLDHKALHAQRRLRPAVVESASLIASYRFGLFAADRSRIVIDLGGPARIVRATTETSAPGKNRLVITLAKADRPAFEAAASKALALVSAEPAAKAAEAQPDAGKGPAAGDPPVVVIDPGHGGVDSGAMADGLVEKTIVFEFAKELAGKLTATGRYKVVMTRDSDVFIPLGGRVKIAHDAHAALLISVHADMITSEAQSVSGATVYTNSSKASDAEAARTAEKENQSDATAGVEGKEEPTDVSDILFDLTRRETRAYSHVFARTLVNYWRVAARLNKNPERAAGFRVLTAPDVPSVLLELGYLSNAHDGQSLVSPQWRDATTSKVVTAVDTFFNSRASKASNGLLGAPQIGGPEGAARLDETPTSVSLAK